MTHAESGEASPQLYLMLGRMDGKLDALISKQEHQDRRLDSHSDRIKKLEDRGQRTTGFITATRLMWAGAVGLVVFAKDIWNIISH